MRPLARLVLALCALALLVGVVSWRHADGTRLASPHWTRVGCIQLRPGFPCQDVYRDTDGGTWICARCGTTRNANPGKCERLSSEQIAAGTWCQGGS